MITAAEAVATPSKEPTPGEKNRALEIVDVAGDGSKVLQFTTSFTATWRDRDTGRVETGTFTAKRPSLGQLGQIAVIKAKMNGGENVDPATDYMHEMMASLQVILTDYPGWWKPHDFFDVRPLREVWDHVRRWVDNFRNNRME